MRTAPVSGCNMCPQVMFYHMTSKIGFIAFKVDIFPMKIYIVVTDVVNKVTYSRKSVITSVVIRFL